MTTFYTAFPYEVVKTISPRTKDEAPVELYGVRNVETGIIEAYISQLAKARFYADQFQYDNAHPMKVVTEEMLSGAVGDMFSVPGSKKPKAN